MLTLENVQKYLSKCLGADVHSILEIGELSGKSHVLDCRYQSAGVTERCILKVYHKDNKHQFDDYSKLGVVGTARKVHLASVELSGHFIRMPRVLGSYLSDEIACIAMEKVDQVGWGAGTRVEAADMLARLHNVPTHTLSSDFQRLVTDSQPNRDRIRFGVIGSSKRLDKNHPGWRAEYLELSQRASKIVEESEPLSSMTTLVHGDYFSVNMIPTAGGLYVIDWDLLAMGDPMWDLSFLVSADAGLSEKEIRDVLSVYSRTRQIDEDVLRWHTECWGAFWELRKVIREYSENPQ